MNNQKYEITEILPLGGKLIIAFNQNVDLNDFSINKPSSLLFELRYKYGVVYGLHMTSFENVIVILTQPKYILFIINSLKKTISVRSGASKAIWFYSLIFPLYEPID